MEMEKHTYQLNEIFTQLSLTYICHIYQKVHFIFVCTCIELNEVLDIMQHTCIVHLNWILYMYILDL